MVMNYGQPFNQFQPQMQRLQQLEQMQQIPPQDKVLRVQSEEVAKNTQIPLDGTTTYFVFGDTILARNWNIASGSIENKVFALKGELPSKPQQLDVIQSMLQDISNRLPQPKKKEVKDDN